MRWSFVPKWTPALPFAHAFYSRTWEVEDEDEPQIGELDAPRIWQGGTPLFALPILEKNEKDDLGVCGTVEQWQGGALTTDPQPGVWPDSGVMRCCKRPPERPDGLIALGGVGSMGCGGGVSLPELLFMQLVPDPGTCDLMRGTYPLKWDGNYWWWHGRPEFETSGELWAFRLRCVGPTIGGCNVDFQGTSSAGNSFILSIIPWVISPEGYGQQAWPDVVGMFGCVGGPVPNTGVAYFTPS